jgi:hypothetical protein
MSSGSCAAAVLMPSAGSDSSGKAPPRAPEGEHPGRARMARRTAQRQRPHRPARPTSRPISCAAASASAFGHSAPAMICAPVTAAACAMRMPTARRAPVARRPGLPHLGSGDCHRRGREQQQQGRAARPRCRLSPAPARSDQQQRPDAGHNGQGGDGGGAPRLAVALQRQRVLVAAGGGHRRQLRHAQPGGEKTERRWRVHPRQHQRTQDGDDLRHRRACKHGTHARPETVAAGTHEGGQGRWGQGCERYTGHGGAEGANYHRGGAASQARPSAVPRVATKRAPKWLSSR